MPRLERSTGPRMLAKACLACGYRGPSLQGRSRAVRCPACGADLYSRPPRSYAELEGFVPMTDGAGEPFEDDHLGEDLSAWGSVKRLGVRVMVAALIVTPPLVVVAAAGALAALWIVRR